MKNVCIVDTPYALALYLLKSDAAAIATTRFYIDRNFPAEIAARLPCVTRLLVRETDYKTRLHANVLRLRTFLEHLLHVRGARIFAQDHISCASRLIGRCPYTCLEDGPGSFAACTRYPILNRPAPKGRWARFKSRLLHGSIFGHSFGRNEQCINRWLTTAEDLASATVAGRTAELLDLAVLWRESSPEKRTFILHVFCGEDVGFLGAATDSRTLFLTQPAMEDCGLTEAEMAAVYAPSVAHFADGGIAVKRHPRDGFDFARHFPAAQEIRTLLPMQLFAPLGIRFARVVTISSTAVRGLPPETEVIRLGNAIHPKIAAAWGE